MSCHNCLHLYAAENLFLPLLLVIYFVDICVHSRDFTSLLVSVSLEKVNLLLRSLNALNVVLEIMFCCSIN